MWYEKLQQLKWQDGMLAVGLALVTVGIGFNLKSKMETAKVEVVKAKVSPTVILRQAQDGKVVAIDIEGEVIHSGVYQLDKGSRVDEVLIAAGGLGASADREWVEKNLNRAEVISDGMKIFIPKAGETLGTTTKSEISKLININTATIEQLDALPGVGPAIAGRIIDYRTKNGEFKDINELKMVSGIGDKMYEKIKELVEI
jgi:competence protein ComEA